MGYLYLFRTDFTYVDLLTYLLIMALYTFLFQQLSCDCRRDCFKTISSDLTRDARDGDVFVVTAVVLCPAVVLALRKVRLRSHTQQVVQPYLTHTRSVPATQRAPRVPVNTGRNETDYIRGGSTK